MKSRIMKITITGNSKVAKDINIFYKNQVIRGVITSFDLYLLADNANENIKELIETADLSAAWIDIDLCKPYIRNLLEKWIKKQKVKT